MFIFIKSFILFVNTDSGQETLESKTGDQDIKKQQRKLIPVDFKVNIRIIIIIYFFFIIDLLIN